MASVLDYSTTANDNTTVGGVNIAEGMAPGLVNNGMRAMMADTRKWQLDWSGVTTAGAGDAYTLTSNQGITAYADGQRFGFRADRNNTGAATLNIDTRGAKALRKVVGGALAALAADDLVAEAVYDVVYNLSEDVLVIVGFALPTISAFALTLLDDANQGAMQTTLGLAPGTNVQAYNANLASLSGLTLAQGDLLYATAADTLARLAKGTAGQKLVMNAGATAPEWVDDTGTLTYIGSQAVTNDATGIITGLDAYRRVRILGVNMDQSSSGSIHFRVGSGGSILSSSIYLEAEGAGSRFRMTGATLAARSFKIDIDDFNTTNPVKPATMTQGYSSIAENPVAIVTASVLDRISVYSDAGANNITSGTLYYWGEE